MHYFNSPTPEQSEIARCPESDSQTRGELTPAGCAGGEVRVLVTRRRPGAAGCEVTRAGTTPPKPTCAQDLKVGGALDAFSGRPHELSSRDPEASPGNRRCTAQSPKS